MTHLSELRPSSIAGRWYSDNPDRLRQQIDQYLKQAKIPALEGGVVALVVPHAGHRYSGRTAGHAFRTVQGMQRDLVAIVSPYHSYHPSTLLTSAHQAYTTPLGPVWIDQEAVIELNQHLNRLSGLSVTPIVYDQEHSLEIELPFLQRTLTGGFRLLPVMVRGKDIETAQALGTALAQTLNSRSSLLVASTDLSHFYPESVADKLDTEMLHQIAMLSPEGVLEVECTGKGYACGALAVAAVLWAAREMGANAVEVLDYSTSASETGDYESVVGYGAAVILKCG
ncbi:MAG: AmmeMemoRadiSam system protein B [Anaerolineaceae bacterium]|nr:AmmeMemoRadiSam system protein B [Anaerolineaceae bacterium]